MKIFMPAYIQLMINYRIHFISLHMHYRKIESFKFAKLFLTC